MTDDLAGYWVHVVTVERYAGNGAFGPTYDAPATVTGFVDDGQRLVVGPDGEQVTSTARVFLPIATASVPLESKVTLPAAFAERTSTVISVARRDAGGLDLPEHLELALL